MSGARCGSCKAPMRWVVSVDGKRVPLNPTPSPLGRVWINAEGLARFLTSEEAERGRAAGAVLYLPHHATCPAAERHRGVSRQQETLDLFGDEA